MGWGPRAILFVMRVLGFIGAIVCTLLLSAKCQKGMHGKVSGAQRQVRQLVNHLKMMPYTYRAFAEDQFPVLYKKYHASIFAEMLRRLVPDLNSLSAEARQALISYPLFHSVVHQIRALVIFSRCNNQYTCDLYLDWVTKNLPMFNEPRYWHLVLNALALDTPEADRAKVKVRAVRIFQSEAPADLREQYCAYRRCRPDVQAMVQDSLPVLRLGQAFDCDVAEEDGHDAGIEMETRDIYSSDPEGAIRQPATPTLSVVSGDEGSGFESESESNDVYGGWESPQALGDFGYDSSNSAGDSFEGGPDHSFYDEDPNGKIVEGLPEIPPVEEGDPTSTEATPENEQPNGGKIASSVSDSDNEHPSVAELVSPLSETLEPQTEQILSKTSKIESIKLASGKRYRVKITVIVKKKLQEKSGSQARTPQVQIEVFQAQEKNHVD